jgi:hypothetical protein
MSGKILETKGNLTRMRSEECMQVHGSDVYSELEKAYGKYLFVPYDIPKILPYDIEKFKDFYFKHAKFANKIREDIAEGYLDKQYEMTPYLSIDSQAETSAKAVWSKNFIPEIFTEFPELFEQIYAHMPFIDPGFMWTMWSSSKDIIPHRDLRSMIDMPLRVRIKLYDDNPEETLAVQLAPVDKPEQDWIKIPIPDETNSFAWNNLRVRHRSSKFEGYQKILMIFFANYGGSRLNQYVDLLDRSIARFHNNLIIDTQTTIDDYILT